MRVGVIGAGHIAGKVVKTINEIEGIEAYAIASRSLEKAEAFKNENNMTVAYGSYEELIKDNNVDVVYIATPHSFHYEQMILCLKYRKPVICEKAFTTSLKDTKEIYNLFEKEKIFIEEALWTSFMPSRYIINDLLYKEKRIGEIQYMKSYFEMNLMYKERIVRKDLGGGAAMDLGIYPISFVLRTLGYNYENLDIDYVEKRNDVDVYDELTFNYPNGLKAKVITSVINDVGQGVEIYGSNGKLVIPQGANCPRQIEIYNNDNQLIDSIDVSPDLGGYQFEFIEAKEALDNNKIEPKSWTHKESIILSKIIDKILES